MKSGCEKFDSFTFETSKNQLIRTFVRKGRFRVNIRPQESAKTRL